MRFCKSGIGPFAQSMSKLYPCGFKFRLVLNHRWSVRVLPLIKSRVCHDADMGRYQAGSGMILRGILCHDSACHKSCTRGLCFHRSVTNEVCSEKGSHHEILHLSWDVLNQSAREYGNQYFRHLVTFCYNQSLLLLQSKCLAV